MFLQSQGAEDELKHAVAFVRPVTVAFEVVNGFRAYNGGVYTSTSCGNSPLVSFVGNVMMSPIKENKFIWKKKS